MKKSFLFIVLLSASFISTVKGQQLPKEYLDSVRSFFDDWTANQRDFVHNVMDNTAYPIDIDFALYRIHFESLFYPPATVYKLDEARAGKRVINDVAEKQSLAVDSLTLTEDEVDSAISKLHLSKRVKWSKDLLPNARITDTGSYFERWRNTTPGVAKPAYWTMSLPSFFRDGRYCIMFFMYYCGPMCGYEALIVYRKEGNHWVKFGTFSEREFTK